MAALLGVVAAGQAIVQETMDEAVDMDHARETFHLGQLISSEVVMEAMEMAGGLLDVGGLLADPPLRKTLRTMRATRTVTTCLLVSVQTP